MRDVDAQSAAALAERAVPRYTSYPTAPHFSNAVDGDVYGRWLAALPKTARLSLYIHVPFCASMCHYCGCHTKVTRRREPIEAYTRALLSEIALVAEAMPARRVAHIHWGGGTPSMLGPAAIARIGASLASLFQFEDGGEHAIELDPRQVTPALVEALSEAGVTRASLGVQDFDPTVQEAIGRVQPFETVAAAVGLLKGAGITSINFDLIYGLPEQTSDSVSRSAHQAAELGPARIALFGYAHVPWFKSHQRLMDESRLPGPAERLTQAETARAALEAEGFRAIGLDHFARPDDSLAVAAQANTLHRNFQGYTTDDSDALIGLGASSIGKLPAGYAQNAPDIGGYTRAVSQGRFATVRGVALSDDDTLRAAVIERLMCDFAVDVAEVARAHGTDTARFGEAFDALAPLADQGLLRVEGAAVAMTSAGRPFVRLAASAFDAYLAAGRARHSMAV